MFTDLPQLIRGILTMISPSVRGGGEWEGDGWIGASRNTSASVELAASSQ